MIQSDKNCPYTDKRRVSSILLILIIFLSAFLTYSLSKHIFTENCEVVFTKNNLYAECHLFVEFLAQIAVLTRPFLIGCALLLLVSYTKFKTVFFLFFFAINGSALGVSLFILKSADSCTPYLLFAVLYAAVTAVYLIFLRSIHTSDGIRPLSEALVCMMIASGILSTLFTTISLLA